MKLNYWIDQLHRVTVIIGKIGTGEQKAEPGANAISGHADSISG